MNRVEAMSSAGLNSSFGELVFHGYISKTINNRTFQVTFPLKCIRIQHHVLNYFWSNTTVTCSRQICERGVANMKSLLRLVAVVTTLSCFVLQGRAPSGTISGHVIDQSGGVVANAEVRLVNE